MSRRSPPLRGARRVARRTRASNLRPQRPQRPGSECSAAFGPASSGPPLRPSASPPSRPSDLRSSPPATGCLRSGAELGAEPVVPRVPSAPASPASRTQPSSRPPARSRVEDGWGAPRGSVRSRTLGERGSGAGWRPGAEVADEGLSGSTRTPHAEQRRTGGAEPAALRSPPHLPQVPATPNLTTGRDPHHLPQVPATPAHDAEERVSAWGRGRGMAGRRMTRARGRSSPRPDPRRIPLEPLLQLPVVTSRSHASHA